MESLASDKIKVLVADDHPIFRQGIVAAMSYESDISIDGEAENGRQALDLIRLRRPDVALLDMQMPLMSGIEVTRQVQTEKLHVKIVILTMYLTDSDIRQAFSAGAFGYLLKDVGSEELTATIRSVYQGHKRISAEVGAKLAEAIDGEMLTNREIEILRLMTAGRTNKEIAEETFVAESTVKFHIKNIFSKLNVTDRTQAVIVALKKGLTRI